MITLSQIDAAHRHADQLTPAEREQIQPLVVGIGNWTPLGHDPFRTPQMAAALRESTRCAVADDLAKALLAGTIADEVDRLIDTQVDPVDRQNFRLSYAGEITAAKALTR